MPVWHEVTKQWVKDQKLVVLGVIQEQHPARCRLFAQWQRFDWPILHDPINVLQPMAVPIVVAIDEHGIVRQVGPRPETFEAEFINKQFPKEQGTAEPAKARRPDLDALRRNAQQQRSANAWRRLGDGLALWGGIEQVDEVIGAYGRAVDLAPNDGDARFRLGVAYRMRYDSDQREPGDFQAAVDYWSAARAINPNQYIWRRRIEQYGPRLIKPYSFYDWVTAARREITARGEKPIELPVEPSGAEFAHPNRSFASQSDEAVSPDPEGRIHRDIQGLIRSEVAVVPPAIRPGEAVRVYVTLRPDPRGTAHWTNESQPLRLWIDTPDGWQVDRRLLAAPQGNAPETSEPRRLEFEVRAADDAAGPVELKAYALYYVCEDAGGKCLFLRQDIPISIHVSPTPGKGAARPK